MFNLDLRMDNNKTTAVYYIGMVGFLYALFNWSWAWFGIAMLVHVVVISLFSGVIHRYFCHRAYKANPTLMWLLSIITTSYAYATPIGWASLHSAHHAWADTEKDSHIKGWTAVLTAAYRIPPLKFALTAKWFRDSRHELLHKNAVLLVLASFVFWYALGTQYLVWVYLVPLFTLHFYNGLHKIFSHNITGQPGATNRWWLEYILPMGGEWIHKEHHQDASKARFQNRWFELDTGWWVVKLVAEPNTARSHGLVK